MLMLPAAALLRSISCGSTCWSDAAIKIRRLAPAKKPALPSGILSCPFGTDASLAATSGLACNPSRLHDTYVASRPSICACSGLWLQQLTRPELVGQKMAAPQLFIQQPSWAFLPLNEATKHPGERNAGL